MRSTPPLITFSEQLAAIGERAKQLRISQELTQQELAERADVGSATVQRFEKTGQVSMENAVRIAHALGAGEVFGSLFAPAQFKTIDEAVGAPLGRERKRVRRKSWR